jgi:inactivated superfamily I helicase
MIELYRHGCTLEIIVPLTDRRERYRTHLQRLGAEVQSSGGASLRATWPTAARARSAQELLCMTAETGAFNHNADTGHAPRGGAK